MVGVARPLTADDEAISLAQTQTRGVQQQTKKYWLNGRHSTLLHGRASADEARQFIGSKGGTLGFHATGL